MPEKENGSSGIKNVFIKKCHSNAIYRMLKPTKSLKGIQRY